jgi:hypothetical protein
MQGQGDPLADDTIEDIFKSGQIQEVNRLLTNLITDDGIPPGMPPSVVSYLSSSSRLPNWADQGKLQIGRDLFDRYGLICLVILGCGSLPECFVLRRVATVLAQSGQLIDGAYRRILETALMVITVMDQGALDIGGQGVAVIQKIRLMHGAMRRLISHPTAAAPAASSSPRSMADVFQAWDGWQPADGKPLSQLYQAAVLLTFSHVMLRGWRQLGIRLSRDEEEAYLHYWNVVGFLLGVDARLLADNVDQARDLFDLIKARDAKQTDEGARLTRAAIQFSEDFWAADQSRLGRIARRITRSVTPMLMRQLLTRRTCRMLSLPGPGWIDWFILKLVLAGLWIVTWTQRWVVTFGTPETGVVPASIARLVVTRLTRMPRGQRVPFQLPTRLQERWRIPRP